jgi:uncharacterized protein HemX
MSAQKPIGTLGVLVLVLLAAALAAGCGVGRASNQEKISKTATTYLRALADGDTAKACLQLTRHARGDRCEQALKQRLSRLEPDALRKAADGSMDIEVNGNRATARWSEPQPAHFVLAKVGTEWRIDSGYTLS